MGRRSRTLPDLVVFGRGQAELGVGLGPLRGGGRRGHGVLAGSAVHVPASTDRTDSKKPRPSRAGPGELVHRVLRVRHQAHDAARLVADAGDAGRGAVRDDPGVTRDHLPGLLDLGQRGGVGHVGALAALERHDDLLPGGVAAGPRRAGVLDAQPDVAPDEAQPRVAGERAGQQVGLAENLEPVADAEYRQARPGRGQQRGHHRGEPRDRAAAQVVAVGETARQDHGVHAQQVALTVPDRHRLAAGPGHGARRVDVIERPGERDHPDPGPHEQEATGSGRVPCAWGHALARLA